MAPDEDFLWVGQAVWLSQTLLQLLGLLVYTQAWVGLLLILGSSLMVMRSLLHSLKPSAGRQLILWALWTKLMGVFLLLPLLWFSGLGQPWHNRWVWPTTEAGTWRSLFQERADVSPRPEARVGSRPHAHPV